MKNAKTMLRKILLIGAVITAMTVTGCKQPVKKDKGGEVKTFALTVTQPANGTITVKKGGELLNGAALKAVAENSEIEITLTAKDGYKTVKLVVDGAEETQSKDGGITISKTVKVTKALSISGETAESKDSVTITVMGDGGVNVAPDNKFRTATGSKWETVKIEAAKKVSFKKEHVEKDWRLSGPAGHLLEDGKIFDDNEIVYLNSKFIGGSSAAPAVGGFVKIPVPEAPIIGQNSDKDMPGREIFWYGVFRTGRNVKLSPYKMAESEVTYKLWKEVYDWANNNGYVFANKGYKGGIDSKKIDTYDESTHSEDEPVTMINWRDAIVWCNAYTEKETKSELQCVYTYNGEVLKDSSKSEIVNETTFFWADKAECDLTKLGFRLPTDAEWEFAARYNGKNAVNAQDFGDFYLTHINSGSGARLPLGFSDAPLGNPPIPWDARRDELSRIAVYKQWWDGKTFPGKDFDPPIESTAKVKSKEANALGIYDMTGNVWEWCWDWYNDDPLFSDSVYIEKGIVVNPKGAVDGANRVARGGSWFNSMQMQAVGLRNKWGARSISPNRGFRLVQSLE